MVVPHTLKMNHFLAQHIVHNNSGIVSNYKLSLNDKFNNPDTKNEPRNSPLLLVQLWTWCRSPGVGSSAWWRWDQWWGQVLHPPSSTHPSAQKVQTLLIRSDAFSKPGREKWGALGQHKKSVRWVQVCVSRSVTCFKGTLNAMKRVPGIRLPTAL